MVTRNRVIGAVAGTIILGLVGIYQGTLSSLFDTWAPGILPRLAASVSIHEYGLLLIVLVTLGIGVAVGAFVGARGAIKTAKADYTAASKKAEQLAKLDETIFTLLATLPSSPNRETRIKRLLKESMKDATRILGKGVNRAYILHLNSVDSDYLVPWTSYQMPQDSMQRTRFYVGAHTNIERGVAGIAFVSQELRVVHFDDRGEPDDKHYIVFENRPRQPYDSFVVVPISTPANNCLGVLCFDSQYRDTFDALDVQDMLRSLASRMGTAIQINQHLMAPARTGMASKVTPTKSPGTVERSENRGNKRRAGRGQVVRK